MILCISFLVKQLDKAENMLMSICYFMMDGHDTKVNDLWNRRKEYNFVNFEIMLGLGKRE